MAIKYKALIVDDEAYARANLQLLLQNYSNFDIIGECEDGHAAVAKISAQQPDLVFLDIQMPEMNGFEVLKALPSNIQPHIIFVTAYDQYAIKAFEVNALDYILKPFDDQRFDLAIKRSLEQLKQQSVEQLRDKLDALLKEVDPPVQKAYLQRIAVRSGGKIHFVSTNDLFWIEAENQYVMLHTRTGNHLQRTALSQLETQLDPGQFYRTHRSAIVRIDAIQTVEPYFKGDYILTLHNNDKVKLARTRVGELKRLLNW